MGAQDHNVQLAPLITTADELAVVAKRLQTKKRVAFDTESDSLFHYREKVCLIQIATDSDVWLVDPLASGDLSALAPIFSSKKIEKVFHGADYDIACLKRDFGFKFNNLFDTMIAAQFLGREAWGLSALVHAELGISLQKSAQLADWSQRPIPEKMRLYAQEDVAHLIKLRDRLAADLDGAGRMAWLRDECEALSRRERLGNGNTNTNGFLRIKGAKGLAPRELGVLRELHQFRERWAEQLDRPPFKVIGNGALIEIARRKPVGRRPLLNIKGVSRLLADRYGKDLIAAVTRGLDLAADKLPVVPPAPRRPRVHARLDRVARLRAWRKQQASSLRLDEGVFLSQNLIRSLADVAPKTRKDMERVDGLRQWRIDSFGDDLLRVLWANHS